MFRTRIVALVALAAATPVLAQAGRAFTYQGQLKDNGNPVTGTFDISASLFSGVSGGAPIGSVCLDNVTVNDGVFSVELDFGVSAFDGNDRYIELAVRADNTEGNCGGAGFTTLVGRQRVSPAPYAVRTLINPSGLDASDGAPENAVAVNANGLVGIGTTTPTRNLHLVASNNPEFLMQDTSAGGRSFFMGINSASDAFRIGEMGQPDRLTITGNGFFGFNTTNPSYPISVRGTAVGANINLFSLRNENDNERWLMSLNNNNLVFNDRGADRIVFGPGESVALTVNGTTRTRILEITGGSDIAEPFNIAPDVALEPGMVVSIDTARVGELRLSSAAYDTTVAGIVSGANGVNTGLTLSQKDSVADGKHPVALTGRVWCWCDASNGAIKAGDLLTTSATAGHAMKASDFSRTNGAVIGKAMSSLDSGKGMVLVLVNLQ